mgnify:CR=1 FL=1|tara:strand:+ start:582 stop:1559 length:978 start_codon:yes stop_codon:yes gene_type:complete
MRSYLVVKWALLLCFCVVGLQAEDEKRHLMRVEKDDAHITIIRGDQVILRYNKVPTTDAAKNEPFYSRSGYIHPIYSPSGKVVTGDYSPDHKHQHGLFFAWTKTEIEGRQPEFWNQKLEKGRVSFSRAYYKDTIVGSNDKVSFSVEHLWEDLTAEGGPKPVLKETWTVTAYNAGDDRFVFDIEAVQWLQGPNPLTVEKYHYGGMAIRGTTQWMPESKEAEPVGTMVTSEGLERIEGNHSRPDWVAMHGPVDDGHAGFAVISDARNFRAPQWVRLHPSMPYFVFSPMVEEPFQIVSGKPYVSRFRYVIFDGEPDEKIIERESAKER